MEGILGLGEVDRRSPRLSRKAASAVLIALALSAVACSDDTKSAADAAVSGAGSGVSTSGVGGAAAGAAGAGTAGAAAITGASGAAAGSGGAAGSGPVVCKIPDELVVDVGSDEDGGVAACDVPHTIFVRNGCTSGPCHHTPNRFQASTANLDLMSPCVADRLVNAPSTTCNALPLINAANPAQSFLLNKLESDTPTCGQRMPLSTTPLPPDQLRCVNAWVEAVVKASKK